MTSNKPSARRFHSRNPSLLVNEGSNYQFESKISEALKVVQTIIENTRNPTLASPNHAHTYSDKFTLTESMTNTAVTALLNVFEKMGLGSDSTSQGEGAGAGGGDESSSTKAAANALHKLTKLVQDEKKSITMRFVAKELCAFVKESEYVLENPHSFVQEETSTNWRGNTSSRTTSRVVKTNVKQYHWNIGIEYGIYLYCGNETQFNAPNSLPIVTRNISCELITKTSEAPYVPSHQTNPLDVSLTWLLKNMDKNALQAKFIIDRERESCRTPRNNDDICEAWEFLENVGSWFHDVGRYFTEKDGQIFQGRDVAGYEMRDKRNLHSIGANNIFVPVLPIFEHSDSNNGHNNSRDPTAVSDTSKSPLLPAEDVNRLLEKQYLTLSETMKSVASNFSSQPFMSSTEATIVLLTRHAQSITNYWFNGINHIENMLCTQLYNAIGKNVSSTDLNEFVRSHNQKLFADSYAPEPFCYAIRRAGCFPDGTISIEEKNTGGSGDNQGNNNNHAMTFTRQLETSNGEYPMYVPINSATYVQLTGELFLHAWMLQRFQEKPSFHLVSRARQFSSFLLLVGKLTGPDTFEPEHGIILQNKDELLIPLLLDEMPSAREFKDAISSLSPEQQRFAKAFRSMKLSSSVFGICVVQLKPQLELLLNLPEKSLTKEIRLTQDLLSLFIDYQIPSDLLSYDGADNLDPSSKVETVKGHVKKVMDMVDEMKDKDLQDERQKADMAFELDSVGGSAYEGAPDTFYSLRRGGGGGGRGGGSERRRAACVSFGAAPVPLPKPSRLAAFAAPSTTYSPTSPNNLPPTGSLSSADPFGVVAKTSEGEGRENHEEEKYDPNTINLERNQIKNSSDLTSIPKLLDSKFELFGADESYGGALRSTTVKTSEHWMKKHQKNLLAKLEEIKMSSNDQRAERNKAFDLIDALSRGGVVPMSHSELHIIIASTHCFDKSVVNTVVQDNVNPIEKIERSNLLVASQIHGVKLQQLLSNTEDLERITKICPLLNNN